MFTTYLKRFTPTPASKYYNEPWGKEYRESQYHYRNWDNAKRELENDRKRLLDMGAQQIKKIDRFNHEKGFAEFEYKLYCEGENITLALIEQYFMDE